MDELSGEKTAFRRVVERVVDVASEYPFVVLGLAIALIVDEVPIDVLAERMGTNRNALYKALHDIRVKLRSEMREQGYIHDEHRR